MQMVRTAHLGLDFLTQKNKKLYSLICIWNDVIHVRIAEDN